MKTFVDPNDFPAARKFAYLNAASVAMMYKEASIAVIEWNKDIAENGTMNFDEKAEEKIFDDLRKAASSMFNAQKEDIAVASSATELMSSLAWASAPRSGSNIIGTDISHPSTIYPWVRVSKHMNCEVRWARGENGYVNPNKIVQLIDNNTSIVCISHAEYGGGQLYDLALLADIAHSHGALLIVDVTQSAGAVPLDVASTKVDAIVTSAYKWFCGPFGVAMMYITPNLQNKLDPGLVGWRSHKDMWDFQGDRLEYPDTAKRFEFSTMAYGCPIGLARSIEYLHKVGVEKIFEHNKHLSYLLIQGLEERRAEIISPKNDEERSSIVAARFPGKSSPDIAGHLNTAKVMVSSRKDFIRFSPHLYNEADDIQRALEEIDRILK